ncbi:hypothetical protein MMC10_009824 [Thelotrema lepadinum]|nr:hypothetical protein [Thelotrema lepadinum]
MDEEKQLPSTNESTTPSSLTAASADKIPAPSHEQLPEAVTEAKPVAPVPPANKPAGPGPPPNGGLTAWLQVLGSFMLFFNTWGFLNTFGVFQTYYESGALFTETSSNIAWIGGIQAYMLLTVGFFSGPIYDRGYLRALVILGSFLIVFGLMMLSLCKTFWEALLCQGFVVGIGAGCLFVPCVAVLPTYFSTKLGLAVGIAVAGASLGGVIYPIILYQLLGPLGFGWSVRVLAFIAFGTLLIPIAVMKMRLKPPKPRTLTEWSAFSDWPWDLFTLATLIGFTGLAIVLFYVSFYGADQSIVDNELAFYIVPIFNAASCFGRVLPNALADKTGPFNILVPGTGIFGILILCMIAVKSKGAFIVQGLLIGFFSGLYIALPPICFVAITKDKSKLGSRMGMSYSIIAFSMLIGGAGGGSILGVADPLNWPGLWIFGGVMCCASSVLYGVLRVGKYGAKLNAKA